MPVEHDSVPLHLVGEESAPIGKALAEVIVEEPGYWELYGPLLNTLHPDVWKEAIRMARTKGKRGDIDLSPMVEEFGIEKILALFDVEQVIDTLGEKKIVKKLGVDRILANLSPEDRQKFRERLK